MNGENTGKPKQKKRRIRALREDVVHRIAAGEVSFSFSFSFFFFFFFFFLFSFFFFFFFSLSSKLHPSSKLLFFFLDHSSTFFSSKRVIRKLFRCRFNNNHNYTQGLLLLFSFHLPLPPFFPFFLISSSFRKEE